MEPPQGVRTSDRARGVLTAQSTEAASDVRALPSALARLDLRHIGSQHAGRSALTSRGHVAGTVNGIVTDNRPDEHGGSLAAPLAKLRQAQAPSPPRGSGGAFVLSGTGEGTCAGGGSGTYRAWPL